MFELAAPFPAIQTISYLPNQQFSDSEGLLDSVAPQRAIDGTLYTYVKRRGGRRKIIWTFLLTRNKALELLAFARSYASSRIRVTDHNERIWVGYITNNPIEFTTDQKAGPAIQGWPVGERVNVTIEFEGVEQ